MLNTPAHAVGAERDRADTLRMDVATQRIQVGMIHARKIVTVTADDHSFRLDIDGETIAVVPRTTAREIHRYKASATRRAPVSSIGGA